MIIETRNFGKLEVEKSRLIRMVQPILGFEELDVFALLSDTEVGNDFRWLQSVEDSDVCFVLVNPKIADANYNPKVPNDVLKQVKSTQKDIEVWSIAVIPQQFEKSTVNLKSPIIINAEGCLGAQIILEEGYPIRMSLLGESGGAE